MKRSKQPTIQDVAKEANVAVMTASRAMRGAKSVRPALAARVEKAAAKLGYQTNLMARALRNQRSNFVTMAAHQLYNPFFGSLAETLATTLEEAGLQLLLCQGVEKMVEAHTSVGACAGILLSPTPQQLKSFAATMRTITVGRDDECPDVAPDVSPDHGRAYRAATEQLLAQGRNRFVFACRDAEYARNYHKKFSFVDETLKRQNCEPVRNVCHTPESTAALVASNRKAVDAVFCTNDVFAAQVLVGLQQRGVRCPDEVLVIGCDGTLEMPGMATFHIDCREISLIVGQLLDRVLKGERITGQWLIRPKFSMAVEDDETGPSE